MAAIVVLWLPLTVLPILDGMLFLQSGQLVARDVGLLLLLGALLAPMLASLAWMLQRGLSRWRGASVTAWTLLLLPLALLVLRQSGRVLLEWLRSFAPGSLSLGAGSKLALLALVAALLLLGMRRYGWSAALARLLTLLQGLRGPALLLLALAALLQLLQPPSWVPMRSRDAAPQTASQPGPDVLLILLDTVAAVDADACNPQSSTMPRLARFAQQANCFTRFQTASNFTTSSVSTLETGLLPWLHEANQPDASIHAALRDHTAAAQLKAAGWRTHFITDNLLASPRHRGSFAAYDSAWLSRTGLVVNIARYAATRFPDTALPRLVAASLAFLAPLDQRRHQARSPYESERVYADLQRLFEQERQGGQRQFVVALTLPPHAPYLPPPSTRYRLLPAGQLDRLEQMLPDNLAYTDGQQSLVDQHRLRYRESLIAADAALGEALDRLEREGRLRNTLVLISTDHGESFEKGYLGHAGAHLHQALVQGPLVIRLPGQTEGRVISQPVSQADLAPTLLDFAGAAPLPAAEGRSLRPLLEGGELAPAPVFSMALEHQRRDRPLRHGLVAVVDGDWKLEQRLDNGQRRLFRLDQDPAEAKDLLASEPQQAARLAQLLSLRLQQVEQRRSAR